MAGTIPNLGLVQWKCDCHIYRSWTGPHRQPSIWIFISTRCFYNYMLLFITLSASSFTVLEKSYISKFICFRCICVVYSVVCVVYLFCCFYLIFAFILFTSPSKHYISYSFWFIICSATLIVRVWWFFSNNYLNIRISSYIYVFCTPLSAVNFASFCILTTRISSPLSIKQLESLNVIYLSNSIKFTSSSHHFRCTHSFVLRSYLLKTLFLLLRLVIFSF